MSGTSPRQAVSSFQPVVFGKYHLVERIGRGGMAEVFKAVVLSHGGFEKVLVIKRILRHLSDDDEFVGMFTDEARVAVALQHANIVQVFDFGRIQGSYYLAMELVEGKDCLALLRRLTRNNKVVPPELAIYIAHEICKGLDYAHKQTNLDGEALGIVHRDISHANILLSYGGEVKITDFGIAKAAISSANTDGSTLKGKVDYMSPEQVRGEPVDQRSDIFSTGIILFELLTGRRLFRSDTVAGTLEKIRLARIPAPREANPAISRELEAVILRALAAQPGDRYQDSRHFQADLRALMSRQGPDGLRERFSDFMMSLFSQERLDERRRLQDGIRAVGQSWEQVPEITLEPHWEESPEQPPESISQASAPAPGPAAGGPLRIYLLLALLGLVCLVAAITWLAARRGPPTGAGPGQVQAPQPVTPQDDLSLPAEPVRGKSAGAAARATHAAPVARAPATPPAVVSPTGASHAGDQSAAAAGSAGRVQVLQTVATESESGQDRGREPHPPEAPATIAFRSSPEHALVKIDGREICRTPCTWNEGVPGTRYAVEMLLDGHEPASSLLTCASAAETQLLELVLEPAEPSPGTVSISVSRGWGRVYIDGEKLAGTTPIVGHSLLPGQHLVRVEIPSTSRVYTRTIFVESQQDYDLNFNVN